MHAINSIIIEYKYKCQCTYWIISDSYVLFIFNHQEFHVLYKFIYCVWCIINCTSPLIMDIQAARPKHIRQQPVDIGGWGVLKDCKFGPKRNDFCRFSFDQKLIGSWFWYYTNVVLSINVVCDECIGVLTPNPTTYKLRSGCQV